VPATYSMTER